MGRVSTEEGLVYNYWLTILALIKIGIPYNDVLTLTEDEIAMVLGVEAALEQREADEQQRQQRMAEHRQNSGIR